MNSIKQLQGMDYLLKRLINQRDYKLYGKNVKLVIKLNNEFWHGDFINFESHYVAQKYIDHLGSVDTEYFNERNEPELLDQIMSKYTSYVEKLEALNPFKNIDDMDLLFFHLTEIVKLIDINDKNTPLRPYLYNAQKTGAEIHFDFMDLTKEDLKVVSLIELR